ncbi:MAG TPA: Do family serine endopeptidase [Thermoanaerobaculia bacterium]|nr:Do family serine endopeptidase [Thermoanaerobaculia bacterium]
MKTTRSQLFATLVLTSAAVLFGMILAGGGQLTPAGFSAPAPQRVVVSDTVTPGLPSFADLAEAVLPAVVTVRAVTIGANRPTGNPFEFFFGPRSPRQGEPREYRGEGAGSGFVLSPDGWIVTNHHVVDGATSIHVEFGGRTFEAELKGKDPTTDLALLKLESGADLPYLTLGDSDTLRVGDWVMAVGSPLYLQQSVTVGVVSAMGRSGLNITDSSFENFIQTDAAINRGNSGGPLVNLRAEVVGINTAMNFGAENIGFSVPVNTLAAILDQLKSTGRVRRGYLGVNITNLDHDTAEAFGVGSTDGALVQEVQPRSPAQEAGLRNGDIIVAVDGNRITDTRRLIDYVAAKPPGSKIELELVRSGKAVARTVTLEERPQGDQIALVPEPGPQSEMEWLGVQYQDLSPGLREMHGIPGSVEGVWITEVAASSPLIDQGIQPGDVVAEVNGEPVADAEQFVTLVSRIPSGQFARLYVWRTTGGDEAQGFFAVVRVP